MSMNSRTLRSDHSQNWFPCNLLITVFESKSKVYHQHPFKYNNNEILMNDTIISISAIVDPHQGIAVPKSKDITTTKFYVNDLLYRFDARE